MYRANIESELKYNLTQNNYWRLRRFWKKITLSTDRLDNYYLDDLDLSLRNCRIGFRVRCKNKKEFTLTLKFPPTQKIRGPSPLSVKHEVETPLTSHSAIGILKRTQKIPNRFRNWILRLCPQFKWKDLSVLGCLTSYRTLIQLPGVGRAELDRVFVLGKRFYELEIETRTPRKTHRRILATLDILGVPTEPSTHSKLARFLKEWKKNGSRILDSRKFV